MLVTDRFQSVEYAFTLGNSSVLLSKLHKDSNSNMDSKLFPGFLFKELFFCFSSHIFSNERFQFYTN